MQELPVPSEPTRSSRPLRPLHRRVRSRRQRSREFVASSPSSCQIVQYITSRVGTRTHSTEPQSGAGTFLRCIMLRRIFGSGLSVGSVTWVTGCCDAQTSPMEWLPVLREAIVERLWCLVNISDRLSLPHSHVKHSAAKPLVVLTKAWFQFWKGFCGWGLTSGKAALALPC